VGQVVREPLVKPVGQVVLERVVHR
jgi:hypothetical protein